MKSLSGETSVSCVDDLLKLNPEDFLYYSYINLLKREPDKQGYEFYFNQIKKGASYKNILFQITQSQEGKTIKSEFEGLNIITKQKKWRLAYITNALLTWIKNFRLFQSFKNKVKINQENYNFGVGNIFAADYSIKKNKDLDIRDLNLEISKNERMNDINLPYKGQNFDSISTELQSLQSKHATEFSRVSMIEKVLRNGA